MFGPCNSRHLWFCLGSLSLSHTVYRYVHVLHVYISIYQSGLRNSVCSSQTLHDLDTWCQLHPGGTLQSFLLDQDKLHEQDGHFAMIQVQHL